MSDVIICGGAGGICLLPSRPSHHRVRNTDTLLIWEPDSAREGFPYSHGQITRDVASRHMKDF